MEGNLENCSATRLARVNAMGSTKREFSDNEKQKSLCMSVVYQQTQKYMFKKENKQTNAQAENCESM